MDRKTFFLLGIFLFLTIVTESRILVPRSLTKGESSGNGELPLSLNPLEKDKNFVFSPPVWDQPAVADDDFNYEYEVGIPHSQPSDYDYRKPGESDIDVDNNKPEIKPVKFPSDVDHDEGPVKKPGEKDEGNVDKKPDVDESGDKGFHEPFDGEEDFDESVGHDKDSGSPVDADEDKSIPKAEDESHDVEDDEKKEPEGDDSDKKDDTPVDDEKESDEKEGEEEDDNKEEDESEDEDKKEHVPEEEDETEHEPNDNENKEDHVPEDDDESDEKDKDEDDDDEDIQEGEDGGFFSGGSIFDNPFFNLEQVKKYFNHLERAVGHVFRQTLDEAILLNGTYANTTEEEVDIDGKKYIVQKSVIKGADNHSSIYVETLSSKPKMNDTEGMENTEIKNITNI